MFWIIKRAETSQSQTQKTKDKDTFLVSQMIIGVRNDFPLGGQCDYLPVCST